MPQVRSVAIVAILACCATATSALAAGEATEAPATPVRELVDGVLKALPQAEPPLASPVEPESAEPAGPATSVVRHLTKVLPSAPAPTQHAPAQQAPPPPAPSSDPMTSGQGSSSPAAAEAGEQGSALQGPASVHLAGAVSRAQSSADQAAARGGVSAPALLPRRGRPRPCPYPADLRQQRTGPLSWSLPR